MASINEESMANEPVNLKIPILIGFRTLSGARTGAVYSVIEICVIWPDKGKL